VKELQPFITAGFKTSAAHERREFDTNPRWYVTITRRVIERNPNGSKKRGVGANSFVGAGDTIEDAIANLIANVDEMALDINIASGKATLEANTDAATAKEQPVVAATDQIDRVRHLLKTHGNSAISLSTLIHSGLVTPNEVRLASGLPALAA
jgi:hypothetical protein